MITINIYYSGEGKNARLFSEEMMGKIAELREKYNLHMRVERYVEDAEGVPDRDQRFIKE